MAEFRAWPKTPRLFREMVITEKLDGTNAAIHVEPIAPEDYPTDIPHAADLVIDPATGGLFRVTAQSRKRLLTPGKSTDNFGFAGWVRDNAPELVAVLGEGLHFGEWWGYGIQRGYGLTERRFSLFNGARYEQAVQDEKGEPYVAGLDVVPLLYAGPFATSDVSRTLGYLQVYGSAAVPGYMRPEGVIVWHEGSRMAFKALLESDHLSKTEALVSA